MTGFSADWLRLREPADARARSVALPLALREHLGEAPLDIVDLGAGTGANLRFLAPRLGGRQRWLLVDDDAALFTAMLPSLEHWAREEELDIETGRVLNVRAEHFQCRVETITSDLVRDLDNIPFPRRGLVTASALLDLVSDAWLEDLTERCRDADAAALFALSYDGRVEFRPRDSHDAALHGAVDQHQLSDKGFGPALGPAASSVATALFEARGYRATLEQSDWQLEPGERALQISLLEDWLRAAVETGADAEQTRAWLERRIAHIEFGSSRISVGHQDLLALP